MWESRLLWARFPRGSWKEWEAGLWLSTLSTAPAFPQLSRLPVFAVAGDSPPGGGAVVASYCCSGPVFLWLFFNR
jgi:hypothetical protein